MTFVQTRKIGGSLISCLQILLIATDFYAFAELYRDPHACANFLPNPDLCYVC
jgi:hypothetical protein